ncbi:MAG: hypothetical protein QF681_06560 [Vicinamibacterales bacterium]|nr:hypothetical protein [Vicinamibacterales bacterium]
MHAGGHDASNVGGNSTWRQCGSTVNLLDWIHAPVASPETAERSIGTAPDSTPTSELALLKPFELQAEPPSPPPRN